MKNLKFLLINHLPSVIVITSVLIVDFIVCFGEFEFPTDNNFGGQELCRTGDGQSGSCILARNCPQAAIDFHQSQIQPTLCYFSGRESVICCRDVKNNDKLITKENNKERISAQSKNRISYYFRRCSINP